MNLFPRGRSRLEAVSDIGRTLQRYSVVRAGVEVRDQSDYKMSLLERKERTSSVFNFEFLGAWIYPCVCWVKVAGVILLLPEKLLRLLY